MDDRQSQSTQVAIVAFNLTIVIYQVVFNMGLFGFSFSVLKLLLGLLLAGGVAAGAFFVSQKM